MTEEIKVVGEAGFTQTNSSVSSDSVGGKMIEYLPVAGDNYRALLPIMPGVVRAPDGRMTMKGARESQGALQVGRGYANDPSTGNFGIELPGDAVESVDVLSNPYGAEDGRFSSTVVRVETRSGNNKWSGLLNGFIPLPCLKLCDGVNVGIRNYRPRGWFGGPLVKDRLFLAQGAQFRYVKVRVPGLPETNNDTQDVGVETFTRLDANLKSGHQLAATFAFFPRSAQHVNLNTLVPADSSPNFHLMGYSAAVSESATLSPTVVAESALTTTVYNAKTFGEPGSVAELTVDGARGSYFDTQERRTYAIQWTEALSAVFRTPTGEHTLRGGLDVMRAAYTGTITSLPVIVRRADGTASQRFDFGGTSSQQAAGTDAAVFAQDRWRLHERLLLEPGVRLERDGVTGEVNLTPRFGFVVGVVGKDTGVLRGGVGIFHERTPLNVGAFESIAHSTVTRFAADGVTPLGPPITFVHRQSDMRTPRSVVWNLEYDQRLGERVFVKVNHTQRDSTGAAIVNPVQTGNTAELWLASDGLSRYADTEVSLRVGANELQQLSVSYVRSHATGNLNAYDTYFGNFRVPIVRPDQYGLLPTDVPNRLLVRGVFTALGWTLSPMLEIRDGFPYSLVDQDQQFVGVRNAGRRFPAFYTVDLSIIRSGTLLGRPVRLGVRGYHLLNNFLPRDVQNNIDSPGFGTFNNSIVRRFALTLTFVTK
jgi:hypothetical protein